MVFPPYFSIMNIFYFLFCGIGSLVIGIGLTALILIPRIKAREQSDESIRQQNEEMTKNLQKKKDEVDTTNRQYVAALEKLSLLEENINNKKQTSDVEIKSYYEEQLKNAQEKVDLQTKILKTHFNTAVRDYTTEYTEVMNNLVQEYTKVNNKVKEQLTANEKVLNDLKLKVKQESSIVESAVNANKRAAEMSEKVNFYKLNISDEDKAEIKELRQCCSKIRNPEPLNKIIWKVYYEKPASDLIGRVIGNGRHTGIYKITNTLNGMCYVGQSVELATRWIQHMKRGIGADTPTKNKLYPAMLEVGIENFTFEVIEECESSELNEKEKFWTDYFKAQEFGYSIRKG